MKRAPMDYWDLVAYMPINKYLSTGTLVALSQKSRDAVLMRLWAAVGDGVLEVQESQGPYLWRRKEA